MASFNPLYQSPATRTFPHRHLALAITAALATGPVTAAIIDVDDDCTLADAITAVNTQQPVGDCSAGNGSDDTIVLPSGTLTIDDWLPIINADMVIQGQGRDQTIVDGDDNFRPFFVRSGMVVLRDLTISNGRAQGGTGSDGGGGGGGLGGALLVYGGHVALEQVGLVSNTARGGDAGDHWIGGGGGGGLAGAGGSTEGDFGGGGGGGGWYGNGGIGGGGHGQGYGGGGGGGGYHNKIPGGDGGQGGAGGVMSLGATRGGGGGSDIDGQDGDLGGGGASGGFGNGGGGSGYQATNPGGTGGFGGGGGGNLYSGSVAGHGGFGGGGGGASSAWSAAGHGGVGGGGGGSRGAPGNGGFGAGDGRGEDESTGQLTGGGGGGLGGAVFIRSGQLRLTDVLFEGNSSEGGASDGNDGRGFGGALFLCDSGDGEGQIDDDSATECSAEVVEESCGVSFEGNTAEDGQPDVFGPWQAEFVDECSGPDIFRDRFEEGENLISTVASKSSSKGEAGADL